MSDEIELFGLGEMLDLLGESTRGAQGQGNQGHGTTDLVGAAQVLQRLSAANPTIASKIARAHPALRKLAPQLASSQQVGINVFGLAGNTVSATVALQTYFKPEKLVAVEYLNSGTVNNPPQTQLLTGAFVGAKNMFPTAPGQGGAIHLGAFGTQGLGTGINWMTAQPAISITLQIQFLATGTFYGVLFGRTVS